MKDSKKDNIRVLFISHEDSNFGAPKSMLELMTTLKNKYNIIPMVALFSKDNIYKECVERGIQCFIVGHRNFVCGRKNMPYSYVKYPFKRLLNIINDRRAYRKLSSKINLKSIDLIHSNVTINSFGAFVAKEQSIPHITHLREPGTVLDSYLYAKPKYVDFLNNNSNNFIAISKFNKIEWEKRGLDGKKIVTIYNGLNLKSCSASVHDNDKIKIVFTGAINSEKSQITLIHAISELTREEQETIEVDIIGTGKADYLNYIRNEVIKNNLSDIINFVGYLENVQEKLKNYDIGIIASKNEAFGRVTVEYMASSLCVIGADSGATPELIKNTENGLLFKVNDYKDLAEKLSFIIKHKNKIKEYGEKARVDALNNYTSDINADKIYNFYMDVLRDCNNEA